MTPNQLKQAKLLLNPFTFFLFALFQVPMVAIAGVRIKKLTERTCEASVPFYFWNKNPFKSIYFAVQSMAAEFSTAALAVLAMKKHSKSIAFIVVSSKSEFYKKATSKVYFTCEDGGEFEEKIQKCIQTSEPTTVQASTVGRMADGTVVSKFWFTWSFKSRD